MEEKVSGGKLARVKVAKDGRATLSGDFFIYPPEGVLLLERTLSGLAGNEPPGVIVSRLDAVIEENELELIGLDTTVIARLYAGAARVESPRP